MRRGGSPAALLSAALLLASVGPALGWDRSALPEAAQGVLVREDGEVLALASLTDLADLAEGELATASALWVWGERMAPVRLDREQGFEPPELPPPRWLEARLSPIPKQLDPASENAPPRPRVVAAPAAMWSEVPEGWLPRWPVGAKGSAAIPVGSAQEPWRFRYLGNGRGTWWLDAAASAGRVELAGEAAAPLELQVYGVEGELLQDVRVRVLAPASRRARQRVSVAMAVSDSAGRVRFEAVPTDRQIELLVEHGEHAPAFLGSLVSRLPAQVRLEDGARLRGRFLDSDRRPVTTVSVQLDAWLPATVTYPLSWSETPGESGAWSFAGLPPGEVLVRATGEGWTAFSVTLDLAAGERDLGEIVLDAGRRLRVSVVDDLGEPVAGATVGAGGSRNVLTDRAGTAVLRSLPSRGPGVVVAYADGHLATSRELAYPLAASIEVILTRSFRVTGRLLDDEGMVPQAPSALLIRGDQSSDLDLEQDGRIQLDLPPGEEAELTLRSTSTLPVKVAIAPGLPGEQRDLGVITAPSGVTVRGWVLSSEDGAPIRGARVASLRATEDGPLIAWMRQDMLETRTGVDGTFELSGLAPGLLSVRIEARGLARKRIALDSGEERDLDLGEIFLEEGAVVEVVTSGGEGLIAHLDLEGSGLPMHMITLPVREGTARFENVPLGLSELSIYRGRALACRREVEVPEGLVEVECLAEELEVHGTVSVGGSASSAATLLWAVPSRGLPEGILSHFTPGGLRQQETFTSLRPEVVVQVDDEGEFLSRDLSPGTWRVTRLVPGSSEASPPETVELSQSALQEVHLRYAGAAVEGRVIDAEGAPVAGARVRELSAQTQAISRADGGFRISGLRFGPLTLQARKGSLRSDPREVLVEEGREHEKIALVLLPDERDEVKVTVVDGDRRPGSAALVFLEVGALQPELQTSDVQGVARFRLEREKPARVRAATFHGGRWALGDWTSWEKASEGGLRLEVERGGSALLRSESERRVVQILGPGDWDLSRLLSWLGARPVVSVAEPLSLAGLPPGPYRFGVGERSISVTVREGEVAEIELD